MTWILVVVALELVWAVAVANRIVSLRQQVRESWSGVLVQLKRRSNVLDGLVPMVSAARDHEALVTALIELRAVVDRDSAAVSRIDEAAQSLGSAAGLSIIEERYPKLRTNENFLQLQRQLADVEDDLQGARMLFNQSVLRFNVQCTEAPALLVARAMRQRPVEYFEAGDLRTAPVSLA